jgi:hypothetical protein
VIADWIRETKSLLTQMGVHIREMVRQANLLTQNAAQSRAQLGALRERIHAGLREMREARRAMRDGDQALIQAEVLALNLVIEAARVGGERGEAVAEMAERLQRLIQKASRVQSRNSAVLARLEAQTEPMATDADLAWHASEPVFQASQAMDEHIRKTTETLIGQAKLVQEVNKKLA